ncbi:MAG: hypothetical protein LKI67_07910 [Olsenella sp.]|jgi:hypothetical protein|nr:hypothetical protein [Olsenella sp.]MCH3957429.1 hypothetical protein [Olsenella sp.]MCI1794300.1 hypothetical protein [Olsenella sp.]MCI1811768.1 hypothetical protein [Olsenella sp.]MCI1880357.1 hypothetical protein [Olsenella sp.]
MNEPSIVACDIAGCAVFPEIAIAATAAGAHVFLGALCNALMLALG